MTDQALLIATDVARKLLKTKDHGWRRAEITKAYETIEDGDLRAIRDLNMKLEAFPTLDMDQAETSELAEGSEGGDGAHGDRNCDDADPVTGLELLDTDTPLEVSAPSATPAHSQAVQEVADSPETAETAEGPEGREPTELDRIIDSLELIDIKGSMDKTIRASIKVCPKNPGHDQGSAWLIITAGEAVKAGCWACKGEKVKWNWYWLRDRQRKALGPPTPVAETPETTEGSSELDGKYVCASSAHDDEWFVDSRLEGAELLDALVEHFSRYVVFMNQWDAWYSALWTAHTHAGVAIETTPRIKVSSPVPGSGKTTYGDHIVGVSHKGLSAASFASGATLAAVTEAEPRTLMLDEFEKLDPDNAKVAIAIINAGYRTNGSRITQKQTEDGYKPVRQALFSFVVMVGNMPAVPDDTMERTHTVLLMPDWNDRAEESMWGDPEFVAALAKMGRALHLWVETADLRHRPELPEGVKGRMPEKWLPLARIAHAAGGEWPKRVWDMAAADIERTRRDREEGLVKKAPHIALLQHIVQDWPVGEPFWATEDMVESLKRKHTEAWWPDDKFKHGLTATRVAKMLRDAYGIRSEEQSSSREARRRGYRHSHFNNLAGLLTRSGFTPTERADSAETAEGSPGMDTMTNHLLGVAASQGQ